MKRILMCLLAAALLLTAACGKKEEAVPEAAFRGVITQLSKTGAVVEVAEGEEERSSSDLISFGTAELEKIGAAVGDTVEVTYTGVIMESYPAQVIATAWEMIEKAPEQEPEAAQEEPVEEAVSLDPLPGEKVPTLGDEPPVLHIVSGEEEFLIGSGNYHWSAELPDGTTSEVIACGMHPLDYTGEADMILFAPGEVLTLHFDVEPENITARCWTEEYWGDAGSYEANFEVVDVDDMTLTPLSDQRYVYELTAGWGDGCGASYIFGTIGDAVPSAE